MGSIEVDETLVHGANGTATEEKSSPHHFFQKCLGFWRLVRVKSDSECWPWVGRIKASRRRPDHQYGIYHYAKQDTSASRLAYCFHSGVEPWDIVGLPVGHTCHNTRCCNPAHLFLGKPADIVENTVDAGRQAKGTTNARSKLTDAQVLGIRRELQSATIAAVAASYGVHPNTVASIKYGKTWAHVKSSTKVQKVVDKEAELV